MSSDTQQFEAGQRVWVQDGPVDIGEGKVLYGPTPDGVYVVFVDEPMLGDPRTVVRSPKMLKPVHDWSD